MDALFVRSQGLTSERQRLRVNIQTQQLPIWRASLQDPASVTARAQSAIYITTAALGLQCVYNLFVKYRLCGASIVDRVVDGRCRPLLRSTCFERSSVEKRCCWLQYPALDPFARSTRQESTLQSIRPAPPRSVRRSRCRGKRAGFAAQGCARLYPLQQDRHWKDQAAQETGGWVSQVHGVRCAHKPV